MASWSNGLWSDRLRSFFSRTSGQPLRSEGSCRCSCISARSAGSSGTRLNRRCKLVQAGRKARDWPIRWQPRLAWHSRQLLGNARSSSGLDANGSCAHSDRLRCQQIQWLRTLLDSKWVGSRASNCDTLPTQWTRPTRFGSLADKPSRAKIQRCPLWSRGRETKRRTQAKPSRR